MPTEGVVQYAGVLDCMRMPAIEGLATLSWTLFYKGFVPSTRTCCCCSTQRGARAHIPSTCVHNRHNARRRARGRAPSSRSPFTPKQVYLFSQSRQAPLPRSGRLFSALLYCRGANAVVQRRLSARERAGSEPPHVTGPVCLSGPPGLSGPARIPWANGLRIASSGALTPQGGRGGERPPAPCPSYGRAPPPAVGT